MPVQEEGEGRLFIHPVMSFCWLLEGEGVRPQDITGWMARQLPVVPIAGAEHRLTLGREELGDSLVDATLQALVTMEEWVQDGLVRDVPD